MLPLLITNICSSSFCVTLCTGVSDVKNLPTIQTWVRSLGWEDPLEKWSSVLAWRIPWTEKPGKLQSMGSQSHTWLNDFHLHFHLLLSLGSYFVFNYSKPLHSINFYRVILFLPTFSIFQFALQFLIWPMSFFLLQNNISEVLVLNEWIYTNLNVHLTTTT